MEFSSTAATSSVVNNNNHKNNYSTIKKAAEKNVNKLTEMFDKSVQIDIE